MFTSLYTSMFDDDVIITKTDLCRILNLDITRFNMEFSESEIQKAYKVRALRFHPDKQLHYEIQIPKPICNILINDITRAKDCLLNKQYDILYKEKSSNAWIINRAISAINLIKTDASSVEDLVDALNIISSNVGLIFVLSLFMDGQLNFRLINDINLFLGDFSKIKFFMQIIRNNSVVTILQFLQKQLQCTGELDESLLREKLTGILSNDLPENSQFDLLISSIIDANQQLKKLLTEEFIDKIQNINTFWLQQLTNLNLPSWGQIMGVYFITLLLTANSIPKYFNALKVISEFIIQYKGINSFILIALPFYVFAALILPRIITLELMIQLTWITLKAVSQLLVDVYKLVSSAINLTSPGNGEILKQGGFVLFASLVNSFIRLSLEILIQTLDAVIFIITDTNQLDFVLENINLSLDSFIAYFRPVSLATGKLLPIIKSNGDSESISGRRHSYNESAQAFGFFTKSSLKLHNNVDTWLNDLLTNLRLEVNEKQQADVNDLSI
ncbi:hypothetical protein [Legionella sp.]|uniref:hypothetical protein n=1 Tax=Legionella sp. TaxID=459 RepID=UPI003C8A0FB0